MGKIIQLDERLANMIAAGEVVERPSSVVKELVENSLDAKATKIEISLTDSGIQEIVVKDNGSGMSRDDAKLCFSRHATSKIKNEYDLFRISTLGFRGEAIPSIASVSTFTLLTSDGNEGTKIIYKGGHLEDIVEASCNKGTTISVKGLFYNVPARLKYLKSLNSELASVTYLVSKFILANPNVAFTLTNNGRLIYQTIGNGDITRIFGTLYGLEAAKALLMSSYQGHGFSFELSVLRSTISRSNKLEITTIVNGRYVKSQAITDAVIAAYHTYIPDGRYPIALIKVELDPNLVDVNVHPTKLQIKISNEEDIALAVEKQIKDLLSSVSMIPEIKEEPRKTYQKQSIFQQYESKLEEDVTTNADISSKIDSILNSINTNNNQIEKVEDIEQIEKKAEESPLNDEISPKESAEDKKQANSDIDDTLESKKTPSLPYLEYCGQVHGTYLIFQNDEGMYLIDQHAAAERINYEYYLEVLKNPAPYSQILLLPINLDFTKSEMIVFEEHLDYFTNLGFSLEQSGINSYFVREIPMWLHEADVTDFIRNVLDRMNRDSQFQIEKYRDHLAASIACKASIKANRALTLDEINALIKKLNECKNPYTCPHGRPTIIKFSTIDLEKMFKRVMEWKRL